VLDVEGGETFGCRADHRGRSLSVPAMDKGSVKMSSPPRTKTCNLGPSISMSDRFRLRDSGSFLL
jgi:hypothetical protein